MAVDQKALVWHRIVICCYPWGGRELIVSRAVEPPGSFCSAPVHHVIFLSLRLSWLTFLSLRCLSFKFKDATSSYQHYMLTVKYGRLKLCNLSPTSYFLFTEKAKLHTNQVQWHRTSGSKLLKFAATHGASHGAWVPKWGGLSWGPSGSKWADCEYLAEASSVDSPQNLIIHCVFSEYLCSTTQRCYSWRLWVAVGKVTVCLTEEIVEKTSCAKCLSVVL